VVEADGSMVSWSYDPTYQLTNEQRSGSNAYNITYSYDAVGNRLTLVNGGAVTTSTYNSANELATSQSSAGVTTFAYDGDGNLLTSQSPANQWTTNTWDGENRLTLVALPSGIVDSFIYSGDGQRVQKQDSTGTTNHVWDGKNILLETGASNVIQVLYTLEPLLYGNLISQSRGGVDSFYFFDGSRSTRQLASSTGSVTDSYLYDSWGAIVLATGSTTNCLRYMGRVGYYWDTDSAKCYVRARTYDPQLARWLSRDPLVLEAFPSSRLPDQYPFARNNPVSSSDPSGLQPPPGAWPEPPPPIWFPLAWGYGWYCGLFRKGPPKWHPPLLYFPPIQPIDPLDAACQEHDRWLRTFWQWADPCQQARCNFALCSAAINAEDGGCAQKYLGNMGPFPVKNWRGYDDCMRAASEIQMLYCPGFPGWWSRVLSF